MKNVWQILLSAAVLGGGIYTMSWAQFGGATAEEDPPGPPTKHARPAPPEDDGQPHGPGPHRDKGRKRPRPERDFPPGGGMTGRPETIRDKILMGIEGGRRHLRPDPQMVADHAAMRKLLEALRSAKNDEERKTATADLKKLLEKSFNRDLERRETQLSEVESKVKQLRDQIEKRKKAKDEIIDLRVKTLVNEAEGLGFPGEIGFDGPIDRRFLWSKGPGDANWQSPAALLHEYMRHPSGPGGGPPDKPYFLEPAAGLRPPADREKTGPPEE